MRNFLSAAAPAFLLLCVLSGAPAVAADADLKITVEDLMTIDAPDLMASRVFGQAATANSPLSDETESTFD